MIVGRLVYPLKAQTVLNQLREASVGEQPAEN